MNCEDYYQNGKKWFFRLHEKGGRFHEVPAHHSAEKYVDTYMAAASIGDDPIAPLWRTLGRKRQFTDERMHRNDVTRMIKRRAKQAGLGDRFSAHSLRATGITAFMKSGGTLETAQRIAAHSSPRTTNLYNRMDEELSLDEIERTRLEWFSAPRKKYNGSAFGRNRRGHHLL